MLEVPQLVIPKDTSEPTSELSRSSWLRDAPVTAQRFTPRESNLLRPHLGQMVVVPR